MYIYDYNTSTAYKKSVWDEYIHKFISSDAKSLHFGQFLTLLNNVQQSCKARNVKFNLIGEKDVL